MNKMQRLIALAAFAGLSTHALADTLGDVLDRGGKRLAANEIPAELVGSWIKWKSPNGMLDFQVSPAADGSLHGNVASMRGISGSVDGKWKVSDDGRFCMAYSFQFGSQHGEFDRCAFWFKAGNDYWAAGSESDRAAPVGKYSVSK